MEETSSFLFEIAPPVTIQFVEVEDPLMAVVAKHYPNEHIDTKRREIVCFDMKGQLLKISTGNKDRLVDIEVDTHANYFNTKTEQKKIISHIVDPNKIIRNIIDTIDKVITILQQTNISVYPYSKYNSNNGYYIVTEKFLDNVRRVFGSVVSPLEYVVIMDEKSLMICGPGVDNGNQLTEVQNNKKLEKTEVLGLSTGLHHWKTVFSTIMGNLQSASGQAKYIKTSKTHMDKKGVVRTLYKRGNYFYIRRFYIDKNNLRKMRYVKVTTKKN